MRKIVFATLIAAGLGFVGWSTASAAPAAGTAIHEVLPASHAGGEGAALVAAQPVASSSSLPLSPLEPLGLVLIGA